MYELRSGKIIMMMQMMVRRRKREEEKGFSRIIKMSLLMVKGNEKQVKIIINQRQNLWNPEKLFSSLVCFFLPFSLGFPFFLFFT